MQFYEDKRGYPTNKGTNTATLPGRRRKSRLWYGIHREQRKHRWWRKKFTCSGITICLCGMAMRRQNRWSFRDGAARLSSSSGVPYSVSFRQKAAHMSAFCSVEILWAITGLCLARSNSMRFSSTAPLYRYRQQKLNHPDKDCRIL